MTDEHTLITRLEAANTEDLARLILYASAEEEKVLRIYLGDTRFRRLRNLVLRREMMRSERGVKRKANRNETRNVVIIPGVLGSELTSVDRNQQQERLWLSPHQIAAGHLDRLHLEPNGLTEANPDYAIRVTGIMKRYYGELMLGLAEHWNVQAFWYDWRKDFRLAAAQLQARIDNWFPAGAPVHLVTHAAGGLVARAYIQQFPQRWALGNSKLIMIGVPNRGVYTAPQAITGHLSLIQWIDLLDAYHDRSDLRMLIKSFPSLYQLLPSPELLPKLYEAATFGPILNVSQDHLKNAKAFHELLQQMPIDPHRMAYIAGDGQQTFVGVRLERLKEFKDKRDQDKDDAEYLRATYPVGLNGDGTVPHYLGVRFKQDGPTIPAYRIDALHGDLCSHPKVLAAINQLLGISIDKALDEPSVIEQIARVSGLQPLPAEKTVECKEDLLNTRSHQETATKDATRKVHDEKKAFAELARRVNVRRDEPVTRHLISVEERDIEERLTHGFISGNADHAHATYQTIDLPTPTIKINLVQGDITDHHLVVPDAEQPIDAIAFGHYSGSKPHGIMRTLDIKISRALEGKSVSDKDNNLYEDISTLKADDADLLLTQYAQRGTIRSDLAQTFFLVDPRDPSRVIAIAGMGEPGRFGTPELTVMVRELCWALGCMGKRHLVTTLIGTGRDNLAIADAVAGWLRGIKLAVSGIPNVKKESKHVRALAEITFFITDPRKLIECDEALLKQKASLQEAKRMEIRYTGLDRTHKKALRESAIEYVRQQMELQQKTLSNVDRSVEPAPTRITVSVEGNTYRFGAITDRASIPEREIPLDPALVQYANDELAAESDLYRQLELGQFMQRLLIPADLRSQLTTAAPLVMMLDSTTARVHWELLAESNAANPSRQGDEDEGEPQMRFLGISRGFTRQLRTRFAPPPEPPPPPQRHLRVLVVADPAADAHLPGAEEEGIAVADLFERFNIVHAHSGNRVEVVRLFGPHEATRTTVLRHLMMRTYDVLHFAGHCLYDAKNPAASGWIFSNGERLSAYEFTRIDRSPAFVFSNACESGITPARSDERSVDLAPSFAEAFFARGVTNFVCTAWPVEDRSARDFALTLYAGLLGLVVNAQPDQAGDPNGLTYHKQLPLPMYKAMQQARTAIAMPPSSIRTWGAYQHYGNPYFRFFDPAGMDERTVPSEAAQRHSDKSTSSTDPV